MKEGSGGDDLSVGVRIPDGNFELPISSNLFLVPGIYDIMIYDWYSYDII